MSAEIHSRHCLWLMLAASLSLSISGVAMAGQIRTVLASFALCLPRPLEVDSSRTELVGPTSSFVAPRTELATNASARSLHKHSHAAQVRLGRASDMPERRTRRAEQEV